MHRAVLRPAGCITKREPSESPGDVTWTVGFTCVAWSSCCAHLNFGHRPTSLERILLALRSLHRPPIGPLVDERTSRGHRRGTRSVIRERFPSRKSQGASKTRHDTGDFPREQKLPTRYFTRPCSRQKFQILFKSRISSVGIKFRSIEFRYIDSSEKTSLSSRGD